MEEDTRPSGSEVSPSPFQPEDVTPPVEKQGIFARAKEYVRGTKEKVYNFLRHKQLRVKEYFGHIGKEEFGELLEYDFKDELKDNTPDRREFSPMDEIKKVKALPIGGRKEALAEFHTRHHKQTIAWNSCRVFIEREIEFDNDVDRGSLMNWVEKFGDEYGFTGEQKGVAEGLIDSYFTQRKKAKEVREAHPNDLELLRRLTGVDIRKPRKLAVALGPMSIDVFVDRATFSKLYHQDKDKVVSLPYVGFATVDAEDKEVFYNVIDIESTSGKVRRKVIEHEWEHQKNRLFREVFDIKIDSKSDRKLWRSYKEEEDPQIKKAYLRRWMVNRKLGALNRVRDEIVAMKRGGWWNTDRFFEQDGKAYDYLSKYRGLEKGNWQYEDMSEGVLVQEYQQDVKKGMEAVDRLEKKGKLSRDETIAMLWRKSIGQWPRAVERYLREQKQFKKKRLAFV
jgi:hypothetical protein